MGFQINKNIGQFQLNLGALDNPGMKKYIDQVKSDPSKLESVFKKMHDMTSLSTEKGNSELAAKTAPGMALFDVLDSAAKMVKTEKRGEFIKTALEKLSTADKGAKDGNLDYGETKDYLANIATGMDAIGPAGRNMFNVATESTMDRNSIFTGKGAVKSGALSFVADTPPPKPAEVMHTAGMDVKTYNAKMDAPPVAPEPKPVAHKASVDVRDSAPKMKEAPVAPEAPAVAKKNPALGTVSNMLFAAKMPEKGNFKGFESIESDLADVGVKKGSANAFSELDDF